MERAHDVICDAPVIWRPRKGVCGMELKRVYFWNDSKHYVHFVLRWLSEMVWSCVVNTSCDVIGKCWNFLKQILSYSLNKNLLTVSVKLEHGPHTRYAILSFAHAPGMQGTFSPPLRVSDPDMHHGMWMTHVPWCMLGSLTSGFLWSRWRGKRSRHSRRMRNPQFWVSVKRPMETTKLLGPHCLLISCK